MGPLFPGVYMTASTYILIRRYNHYLSLDATIMVSENCSVICEHVAIIFVTQYVTIATVSIVKSISMMSHNQKPITRSLQLPHIPYSRRFDESQPEAHHYFWRIFSI